MFSESLWMILSRMIEVWLCVLSSVVPEKKASELSNVRR
ncbi:uncharacterized protein RSE6_12983 [Rhynchosporium secalis]|uniref:Uncharacterized protein n=1 Tax=Rhynchosporium secalis TaxID=38038 RepID=A0A1E1MRR9_RHYSE|nr:uncharacterized protein RSE6_12983 [Rhynchosporium secalis]